jgi:hypothetical protein
MTELLALPWRAYPAAALALCGAALAASGIGMLLRAVFAGRRTARNGYEWALVYLYVFRRVMVGLALIGAGVGWAWQVPWLVAASLCIGAGELLESSYDIWVLRWGQRRGLLLHSARTARTEAQP